MQEQAPAARTGRAYFYLQEAGASQERAPAAQPAKGEGLMHGATTSSMQEACVTLLLFTWRRKLQETPTATHGPSHAQQLSSGHQPAACPFSLTW
jgi:hypothetical protein